jgi:DNA-directed RNA polymerase specialized sigma24 family protein
VERGGFAVVASRFGELGAAGAERVRGEGRARLDAIGEPGGELQLFEGERRAHELGQQRGVVGVGADLGNLLELGEERACPPARALGDQHARDGGEGELAPAELQTLLGALSRYLQAALPQLGRDEAVEVVDGALLELLELAAAGKLEPAQDAAGLLVTIAHRRGIDQLRRARRQDVPLDEEQEAADLDAGEQEEALLEAIASEEELQAMMSELALHGRHDLNAVLRVWLDLTDQLGVASSRLVADRLGIDRSTVNRRLAEIRALLGERERS